MSHWSDRVITGAGIYRRRDGGAAEVVYCRDGRWYGHLIIGNNEAFLPACWRANGANGFAYPDLDRPHCLVCPIESELLVMAGGEFPEPLVSC